MKCFALGRTIVLVMSTLASVVVGEALPQLSEEERVHWPAVGVVNGAGYDASAACSGALIAPDLVLTAAHCARAVDGIYNNRHFTAGWNNGEYLAYATSRAIHLHPAYRFSSEEDQLRFDLAVIQLDNPIPEVDVMPLPIKRINGPAPDTFAIIGYHHQRTQKLSGRFDCANLNAPAVHFIQIGCEVIGGNSGGPVFAKVDDVWTIVAVVVARRQSDTVSTLAVPINDWVIEQLRAANRRARSSASEG